MQRHQPSHVLNRYTLRFCVLLSLATLSLFFINNIYYHYHPLNYFNTSYVLAGIALLLMTAGSYVLRLEYPVTYHAIKCFTLYYLLLSLILTFSCAVELTPFPPIDSHLLYFDQAIGYSTPGVLAWLADKAWLKRTLWFAYDSIYWQLIIWPLVAAIRPNKKYFYEMCAMLSITALIGLGFYYFFPTTAPASIIQSPYFVFAEHETWIKFLDIHHYIKPIGLGGGLVAFPSFHIIWNGIMLWTVREDKWLFPSLALFDTVMACACVMLGWHYVADVLGALLLLGLCLITLAPHSSSVASS